MNIYTNPLEKEWAQLCKRPSIPTVDLDTIVLDIINKVRTNGDEALFELTRRFDKVQLESFKVSAKEIEIANTNTPEVLKTAITTAANNIRAFHAAQVHVESPVTTMPGVTCWRKNTPIDAVGLYIPGGSAPLFSTILMLAIPAQIAGCDSIILCTPADELGIINPAILYTADYLGITEIYKIGGAQAIAAMAFGTESIPKVEKIFGPGNQYVTKAKALVQNEGVAIDLPAGPSEVLIICDEEADPEFIAADLLSQAEHGADSQVVLLSTSRKKIDDTLNAISEQLKHLPRGHIAQQALNNSICIQFEDIYQCIAFSNFYAPEHLILAINDTEKYVANIKNVGSVFLGNYSCESAGDYASGTNHTLPTSGYARCYSGVSVDSFIKKISFQHISKEGLINIGSTIVNMATAEQLIGHANAVTIRLNKIMS